MDTGEAKPRGKRVTSMEVAALAGVSQAAVSRAFTPGSSIKEEKRRRIFDAARELNYVPNSIASSLTTKRTNMVAVILGNMHNPFYAHVFTILIKRLKARGRHVLAFPVENGGDSDDALMSVLRYQVDGIILTSAQLSTRMTSLCHDRGIPIVLFNRYIPGSEAAGVRCDNEEGGRLMAEAFLDAGARTFTVVKGDPRGTTSQDRLRGFVERLERRGVKRDDIIELDGESIYDGGYNAIIRAFGRTYRPVTDAVFGINDIMAMGVMDALRGDLGLRIPEDVMVGGFDNIAEAARWPYKLTTVAQPIERMAEEALDLLGLEQHGRQIRPGVDRKLSGTLIRRSTIAPKSVQS